MNNPTIQEPITPTILQQANEISSPVISNIPQENTEVPYCKTLRNQFPFLWKICLVYGICYLLFSYRVFDGIGSGIFATISSIFILMIAFRLKQKTTKDESISIHFTLESIFYFISAALISFGNCLTDNRFFLLFNHIGSFLLFTIACLKLFYSDKQWDFGKYTGILFTYWIEILEVIPVPFRDFHAYHKKTEAKSSELFRYVLLGIVIGSPILIITTLLLCSADPIMSDILNITNLIEWMVNHFIENIFFIPCCFVLFTLLPYLIFAALCKKALPEEMKEPKQHKSIIATTIFFMIDIVYVLFSGIQFLFLFIGLPIAHHEYAEYAREGFFELLFVALINFFLVLICNKYFSKSAPLKITMTITCLCTFVMIISSAYRMIQYIDVYHLTFLRVFVLWFLAMLTFFMTGTLISIYRKNWNTFRYCLFVLTCFYTCFALSNVDYVIAKYNVHQFVCAWEEEYQPFLYEYLPTGYENSKAYAPVFADLKETYSDRLSSTEKEMIDNYFNDYKRYQNYCLENPDTNVEYMTLYSDKPFTSLLSWKHFNFAENKCYRLARRN